MKNLLIMKNRFYKRNQYLKLMFWNVSKFTCCQDLWKSLSKVGSLIYKNSDRTKQTIVRLSSKVIQEYQLIISEWTSCQKNVQKKFETYELDLSTYSELERTTSCVHRHQDDHNFFDRPNIWRKIFFQKIKVFYQLFLFLKLAKMSYLIMRR